MRWLSTLGEKKYLGKNYEPDGEETSNAKNDPLSFWLFTSPHHNMGDTHHMPRGPKLDMQKFDDTDLKGWASNGTFILPT